MVRYILASLLVIAPVYVSAALVPCDGALGNACNACHVVELGQRLLTWFITIMTLVIAVVFAVGGFKMLMSGGDTGKVSEARSMMTNAVIGFVILLAAYLIIDTVMKTFVNPSIIGEGTKYGPWNKIQCVAPPAPTVTETPTVTPVTPAPTAGCPTCVVMPPVIPTNGNACSGQCVMRPEMASALISADLGSLGLRLSEGYPPVATHSESCHTTATCVDVSFSINNPSSQQIITGANNLTSQGLKPVYEVPTTDRRNELISAGVPASSIITVAGINREHYSVYNCAIDSSPRACR